MVAVIAPFTTRTFWPLCCYSWNTYFRLTSFEARSRISTSSSSSTSRRGEPESTMSAVAAVPGSFAQLTGPPNDHELAAASLGSIAVSYYTIIASFHAANIGHIKGAGGLAGSAIDAMFVLQAASRAAGAKFSSSSSTDRWSDCSFYV